MKKKPVSRRDFLALTASASATAVFCTENSFAGENEKEEKLREIKTRETSETENTAGTANSVNSRNAAVSSDSPFFGPTFSFDGNTIRFFIPGLMEPSRILHITDTHLFLDDKRGRDFTQYSARMAKAYNTTRHWKTGETTTPAASFEASLKLAQKLSVDAVALTGDILSFPSEAGAEWVLERLNALKTTGKAGTAETAETNKNAGKAETAETSENAKNKGSKENTEITEKAEDAGGAQHSKDADTVRIPFRYTAGNHDWHYEGWPGSDAEQRREWIPKRLAGVYPKGADPLGHAFFLKGIRHLFIDDSIYEILPEQLEFLRRELAHGDPTVVWMHIPPYAPGRSIGYGCGNPNWGASADSIWQTERREKWREGGHTAVSMEFYRTLVTAPNLLGTFCGHEHISTLDVVNGKAFTATAANASGAYTVAEFLPMPR